ncbi:FCD domain-containing protein [Frankia sp. ArI3]|uniref:FCD domain-containing protein n=1 Tax=Frankia sp. ArI3 TaxID=1858 RepID=UPI0021038BCB|nr:FCD domain-containing protein [Frankia sp. ArI3]
MAPRSPDPPGGAEATADLAALRAALADRRAAAAGGDDVAFVDADVALHVAIVAAAHNPPHRASVRDAPPRWSEPDRGRSRWRPCSAMVGDARAGLVASAMATIAGCPG